jgi:hypothetical protein
MNTTTSLSELQEQAVATLRRYYTVTERERTEALRETAGLFISAREHFFTREGTSDWLGRTYAYRRWVRECMSMANVPADDVTTVQAAIRYHSGNILRDRLDQDTLDSLGLRSASPRERSVEKRERNSGTLSLFGAGAPIDDVAVIESAAGLVETFLRRINLDELATRDRKRVAAALESMRNRANDVAEEAQRRPR